MVRGRTHGGQGYSTTILSTGHLSDGQRASLRYKEGYVFIITQATHNDRELIRSLFYEYLDWGNDLSSRWIFMELPL